MSGFTAVYKQKGVNRLKAFIPLMLRVLVITKKKIDSYMAIAQQRAKQVGDFDARWRQVRAELPESFAISRLADGLATLYYSSWIESADGGASLESTAIFRCIEKSAQVLGMVKFCKVLRAYDLPLKVAVPMYRVCIPQ